MVDLRFGVRGDAQRVGIGPQTAYHRLFCRMPPRLSLRPAVVCADTLHPCSICSLLYMTPLPVEQLADGPAKGVVVIRLEQHGSDGLRPVVVLDGDLIERLDATLDALPSDLVGLVLASNAPRAFVAGADLKSIVSMNDADLDTYLARGQDVFGRLSQLPCMTAAAIHGATLGGGLELAMHCDLLVGCPAAKPYPIGLPEAGLGLCPGWGGTNLLPARIDAAQAIEITAAGKPMKTDAARDARLFDAWTDDAEKLVETAAASVANAAFPTRDGSPSRWIGRDATRAKAEAGLEALDTSTGPAAAVAACVRAGLQDGWHEALAEERRRLVGLRNTDEARGAIEAFFARSKG